jgi:AmmeMemoRadiSam system protein A
MSHPSENPGSDTACSHSASIPGEYSREERATLLKLAHASIESAFEDRNLLLDPPTPHLAEKRGAFTTLYIGTELRGCVGYVFPAASVYQTVAETARAAAFEDTRFPPLTAKELPHLEVHLSVLSLLQPIRAEEVEVGRHGLLVSLNARRGLLLPQVPVEHGWDRETFLEQTCRKAGLPLDAWHRGAVLEAFTAELFGDKNL